MNNPIQAGNKVHRLFPDVLVGEVYRAHASFCALAASLQKPDLAHLLILCEPLSVVGEASLVAASIASAASLCIEPSPHAVRHSIRSGAIDFTVNNLDEALRALKNEIRKGLSIAVCLEGDTHQYQLQMIERGVQPDVLCCSASAASTFSIFAERGARVLNLLDHKVDAEFHDTCWRVSAMPGQWLPRVDEVVAGILPEEDQVRRRWLARAPRYMGRTLRTEHSLPMRREEVLRLRESLEDIAQSEHWNVIICVDYEDTRYTVGK